MLTISLTTTSPRYRISVTLEDVEIRLAFRWNARTGAWYVDASTADDVRICTGQRVTPGVDLLPDSTFPGLPPGKLIVLGPDPYRRDELGTSVVVAYLTAADVAALEAA